MRGFRDRTKSSELRDWFDPKRKHLIRDIDMKREYAFIIFKEHEDAAAAVRELDKNLF